VPLFVVLKIRVRHKREAAKGGFLLSRQVFHLRLTAPEDKLLDLTVQSKKPAKEAGLMVVPSGLEPGRPLRNCPVGNFREEPD
jgi:hypothetical protein